MSRLLAVAVAVGAAATHLEDLDAHFFAQRLGGQVLESTPVRARSVRASTASLWREGFAHAAADASLAALLAEAADACGRDGKEFMFMSLDLNLGVCCCEMGVGFF